MHTVNFPCAHCGRLMAVGVEFLGRQVRCPACLQILVAEQPAPVTAPAPPPVEDPLFGPAGVPDPFPAPTDNGAGHLDWLPQPSSPEVPAVSEPEPLEDAPAGVVTRPARAPGRVSWFMPLVFLPLLLYAGLCTAVAGYLLHLHLNGRPTSLFEQIPDIEGDTPGVNKVKLSFKFPRDFATQPLPPELLVALGDTLRLGDLEVTPQRVERRKVALLSERNKQRAERSPQDALVLHLRLKNLAADYRFTPLDNFFDRHYQPGNDTTPPLTLLQAGKETFFGGPAKWVPLTAARREPREWLQGRQNVDRDGLGPGEEAETFVATDAWNPAVGRHLFGVDPDGDPAGKPYQGKLLWRVQLRRGLVKVKGKTVPATAVIGVEFSARDYPNEAG